MADLIVSGGTVVTSQGRYTADIVVEGDRIASLERPSFGARRGSPTVDARGLLVFPGFIDPHVHCREPGWTEKEDVAHATRAAAAGGITTIFDMPNVAPPVWDVATLAARSVDHAKNAFVDFGLWGMVIGSENLDQFAPMIEGGAVGIKLFWGHALERRSKVVVHHPERYSAEEVIAPPDTEAVFEMFRRIASCDGLMTAHCEEPGLIACTTKSVGPVRTYEDFLKARPDAAEAAAIALAVEYSRATGCRFHVVHLTSAAGADVVRAGRARGIRVTAETCPQYLTLTADDFVRVGPAMKVNPPIRTKIDQDALWKALSDGTIASIGSDHAPHTETEKGPDLQTANSGMVAIQSMVQLMLHEALSNGRLTIEQLAWLLSESTARLYKIFPQKGAILPGSDADLTVVDPRAPWTISNDTLHSKTHLSAWHGQTGIGLPVYTIVRGNVVMEHDTLVDRPLGQFVRPTRFEEPPSAHQTPPWSCDRSEL